MVYATGLSICLALFAAAELSNQEASLWSQQKLWNPLYYFKHRKQELPSNMSWSHGRSTHRPGTPEGARHAPAHGAGEEERGSALAGALQQGRFLPVA